MIRRLTYDLTGLPPTPEEVDAFAADRGDDAYERLVDRLLDSPHYGEKWGRHWLDLVRYAETNGYERDSAKPFAWRYRDYVIDAFNQDKPFDQFIREQLAGDEVDPTSAAPLIATGYYRLGIWDDEPADRPLARYDGLDGIISTTGQVFLGMTINCARCHDHKVDPIPQNDYYRLLAFFQDIVDPNGKNLKKGRRRDRFADRGHVRRGTRPAPTRTSCCAATRTCRVTRSSRACPRFSATAAHVCERARQAAGAGRLADRPPEPADRPACWPTGSGSITSAAGSCRHPTTSAAWAKPATHPELLDWLAAELMDGGWRLKRMHRLILLSSAYRMSSRGVAGRAGRRPGQSVVLAISDAPAHRRGGPRLDPGRQRHLNLKAGGPSVYPPIPREVLAGQSVPGKGWTTSPPTEAGPAQRLRPRQALAPGPDPGDP